MGFVVTLAPARSDVRHSVTNRLDRARVDQAATDDDGTCSLLRHTIRERID
jgi:hypothetical protein